MKLYLLLILFSILIIACTSNRQDYHIEKKAVIKNGFRLTINNDMVNDYSFLKSASYIFLDSECPINEIDRLDFHNDTFIILDKKRQSVNFYSSNGDFISRISNQGRGPNEYISLDDFAIDHEVRNIIVLDRNSRKLLYYDFDGVFQKDFDLGWGLYNKIAYINSSVFLHNSASKFYRKEQREFYNSLLKFDIKSNRMVGYLSEEIATSHIGMENKAFFKNGINTYYNDRWSFDVYNVDTCEISRLFTVDFQDNEQFFEYCMQISDINDLLNTHYAFDIRDICINEEFICFKYTKDRRPFHVVFNKDQRKIVFHSDNSIFASADLLSRRILNYSHPEFCFKEQFISVVQPAIIKDMYDNVLINNAPKDIGILLEKIKNIDIYDNPRDCKLNSV